MQKREKILAGALGATVLGWFGWPIFSGWFLQPLRDLDGQVAALTEQKELQFATLMDLARKDAQMGKWRARSLPKNVNNAQRLYQEWLLELANSCGIRGAAPTLDPVRTDDVYATIPIKLTLNCTLPQFLTFLERFESVDLMHRISKCEVSADRNEGNPPLKVTLTAEGLSLQSSADRPRIFPQTDLFEPLAAEATTANVTSAQGFPEKTPFRVRIGHEIAIVTEAKGTTWTLQRGVEESQAISHGDGQPVELFPLLPAEEREQGNVTAIAQRHIFVKPSPPVIYEPKLKNASPPIALRGRNWTFKAEIEGWDPAWGEQKFELVSAPEQIRIDPRTGQLNWNVDPDISLGEHQIAFKVSGEHSEQPVLQSEIALRVREPNIGPKIEESKPLRFFIGREAVARVNAADGGRAPTPLKYSLQNAPEGMSINAETGEIRWQPPESMGPQELKVNVTVTDTDETPESATAELTVSVEEDSARFAYLTGYVATEDGKESWIYDRATNRMTVIHEGEHVVVADFDMIIEQIHPTYIIVRRGNERYRLESGQPLIQMTLLDGDTRSTSGENVGKPL